MAEKRKMFGEQVWKKKKEQAAFFETVNKEDADAYRKNIAELGRTERDPNPRQEDRIKFLSLALGARGRIMVTERLRGEEVDDNVLKGEYALNFANLNSMDAELVRVLNKENNLFDVFDRFVYKLKGRIVEAFSLFESIPSIGLKDKMLSKVVIENTTGILDDRSKLAFATEGLKAIGLYHTHPSIQKIEHIVDDLDRNLKAYLRQVGDIGDDQRIEAVKGMSEVYANIGAWWMLEGISGSS